MSRTGKLIAAVAAVAILATLGLTAISPSPAAGDDDDWVAIDQWGYVITEKGKYRVANNLSAPANVGINDPGIRIRNTKDVELDLNGRLILGKGLPNDNRMGLGIAISVENSEDVKIYTSGNIIARCNIALRISASKDVEFDGNGVLIEQNSHGIQVFGQSKRVRLKNFRMYIEKYIDIYCDNAEDVQIKDVGLRGGSQTGVSIWNSEDVDIKNCDIGRQTAMQWGVLVKNSTKTDIEDTQLNRCNRAVSLTGSNTKNTEIRKCKFGQLVTNACDLQVTQGAEEPDLDDNEPENLNRCN